MSAVGELGPAYRVRGPSALSGDGRRFLHLTVTLAYNDWKLRFFGSVLGYLWQLLRPLMLFGVLLLVFTEFLPLAKDVRHYDVTLLDSSPAMLGKARQRLERLPAGARQRVTLLQADGD